MPTHDGLAKPEQDVVNENHRQTNHEAGELAVAPVAGPEREANQSRTLGRQTESRTSSGFRKARRADKCPAARAPRPAPPAVEWTFRGAPSGGPARGKTLSGFRLRTSRSKRNTSYSPAFSALWRVPSSSTISTVRCCRSMTTRPRRARNAAGACGERLSTMNTSVQPPPEGDTSRT